MVTDDKICPSSVSGYLQSRGFKCNECRQYRTFNVRKNVPMPVINSQKPTESDENVGNMDFLEWQEAMALGIDM